jgi:hypothetical protein
MVFLVAGSARAVDLFEDFGAAPCTKVLAAPDWFGKLGAPVPFSGTVVTDPLDASNCVLTFRALTSAGDTFSKLIAATPGTLYVVEFDYLGLPGAGVPGDLGGTLGISDGFPGGHRWLAGTTGGGGIEADLLADDGAWHHYAIVFDPFSAVACCGYNGLGSFHLMLEDFVGSAGVPADAFFDNLEIRAVDGACCTDAPGVASDCIVATEADCRTNGGLYLGNLSRCTAAVDCLALVVSLESFTAEATAEGVLLEWVTASEVETVGFRIVRETPDGRSKAFDRLPHLIPAAGHGLLGASYQFLDNGPEAATAFQYYLEDVDIYGRVTSHGPVTVERVPAPGRVREAVRIAGR